MKPAFFFSPRLAAVGLLLAGLPALAQDPAVKLDVPYVPTPPEVVERMLEMAAVGPEDYVIDLGSGDGRIAIAAARHAGARALGVDIDPQRIAEAVANAHEAGVSDRVEFRQQDLFKTEIRAASVLTMYLLPSVNLQLRERILTELEPGTRVVSHAFNMGDWEPDERDSVGLRDVFLWIVPARVEGQWWVEGEERFLLTLKQDYQYLSGQADMAGRRVRVQASELRGDRLTFRLDGRKYVGRVKGDIIQADGAGATWRATRR